MPLLAETYMLSDPEQPRPSGALAACAGVGGWLRIHLVRCASAAPIGSQHAGLFSDDHSGGTPQVVAAQCSCALASRPGVRARSSIARGDGHIGAVWDETLWLQLPRGDEAVTLIVELWLSARDAEQRMRCGGLELMPRLGTAHVRLRGTSGGCWCAVRGSGPVRSDGEPQGSAEVYLEFARVSSGAAAIKDETSKVVHLERDGQGQAAGADGDHGGCGSCGGDDDAAKVASFVRDDGAAAAAAKGGRLVDEHGFELHGVAPREYRRFVAHYALRRAAQRRAWSGAAVVRAVHGAQLPLEGLRRALARPVALGVPAELRPRVWLRLAAAWLPALLEEGLEADGGSGYYARLSRPASAVSDDAAVMAAADQIELDLPRTFPAQPELRTEAGKATLRRVLMAHCRRNPALGYTQSLNFVAALLLLQLPARCPLLHGVSMGREAAAFWLLCTITEVLLPEHFTAQMVGVQVDNRVLAALVASHAELGGAAAAMARADFDLGLVSTQWLCMGFIHALPCETTLRLWDLLWLHGAPALFAAALATVGAVADPLADANGFEQVYGLVKTPHLATLQCDGFVRALLAELPALSHGRLAALRAPHRREVMVEMAARDVARRRSRSHIRPPASSTRRPPPRRRVPRGVGGLAVALAVLVLFAAVYRLVAAPASKPVQEPQRAPRWHSVAVAHLHQRAQPLLRVGNEWRARAALRVREAATRVNRKLARNN